MAQECSLSIGYLFGRLAQEQCGKVNCVRPDMILAFVRGLKTAIKHINEKNTQKTTTKNNNKNTQTNAEKLRNLQVNQHICKSLHRLKNLPSSHKTSLSVVHVHNLHQSANFHPGVNLNPVANLHLLMSRSYVNKFCQYTHIFD